MAASVASPLAAALAAAESAGCGAAGRGAGGLTCTGLAVSLEATLGTPCPHSTRPSSSPLSSGYECAGVALVNNFPTCLGEQLPNTLKKTSSQHALAPRTPPSQVAILWGPVGIQVRGACFRAGPLLQ
eukprot:2655794-Rhodomonas_salina.1